MTDAKKLTKVIEKAEKNGWELLYFTKFTHTFDRWLWLHGYRMTTKDGIKNLIPHGDYKLLLIDHDFAKAFWGESGHGEFVTDSYYAVKVTLRTLPNWQFHLQQAIVSDNMLDYYFERL